MAAVAGTTALVVTRSTATLERCWLEHHSMRVQVPKQGVLKLQQKLPIYLSIYAYMYYESYMYTYICIYIWGERSPRCIGAQTLLHCYCCGCCHSIVLLNTALTQAKGPILKPNRRRGTRTRTGHTFKRSSSGYPDVLFIDLRLQLTVAMILSTLVEY